MDPLRETLKCIENIKRKCEEKMRFMVRVFGTVENIAFVKNMESKVSPDKYAVLKDIAEVCVMEKIEEYDMLMEDIPEFCRLLANNESMKNLKILGEVWLGDYYDVSGVEALKLYLKEMDDMEENINENIKVRYEV